MRAIPLNNYAQPEEIFSGLLPYSYIRNQVEILTTEAFDKISLFTEQSVPIWYFTTDEKKLRSSKPITMRIERGDDSFFCENDNLAIYATGGTREEAIGNFSKHLIHFYYHYRRYSHDQVTGKAKTLKRIYENTFTEVQ